MKSFACNRSVLVFTAILISLILFITCSNPAEKSPDIENAYGEKFAGTASCASCHSEIHQHFLQTAHYNASGPGTEKFIKGSFEEGENYVAYNYYDRVIMEKRDSGLYQAYYYKDIQKRAERMDIVIGSGIKGQTYLYWKNRSLYQLPVSYFGDADQWTNSPGNGEAIVYNRIVYARCLECHTTFAKTLANSTSEFDKSKIMYGINCESCHGAAGRHVEFQSSHPEVKTAKYIVNPAPVVSPAAVGSVCRMSFRNKRKPATFLYIQTRRYTQSFL